jgi:hypothetical protein
MSYPQHYLGANDQTAIFALSRINYFGKIIFFENCKKKYQIRIVPNYMKSGS